MDGPLVARAPPILVNFLSFEEKSLVWRCLKDGCRSTSVVVTQDSGSRRDKAGIIVTKKKKKKINFHARCHHPIDSGFVDDSCDSIEEELDEKHDDDPLK